MAGTPRTDHFFSKFENNGKCQIPHCSVCKLEQIDRTDLAEWELSVEIQLTFTEIPSLNQKQE